MEKQIRDAAALLLISLLLGGGALIGARAASAAAFSETTPFTYAGSNTCTGEAFSGTGTLHFLMSDNLSPSGAVQHHLQTTIDGLQAVTLTGKRYVVQDLFRDDFTFSGASEENFDVIAHYVRQGEDGSFVLGDDFYEYLRTHITANANGMITAFDVRTSDIPCQ